MSTEHLKNFSPTDPELIDRIVNNIKSKGIFDQFRKDCLADVDTKPAYQNLQQRVNGTVTGFLSTQKWQHGLNKTHLRESLRRHTVQQGFLEVGVDRIVDQVVNPKIFSVFMPKVEDVVCECLGIEKPKPKPLALNFQQFKKSLLPTPTPTPQPVLVHSTPIPPIQVKEEEPKEIKKIDASAKRPDPPSTPTHSVCKDTPKLSRDTYPVTPVCVARVLKNDDNSNTTDEMRLLTASNEGAINRAVSPVLDSAPLTINTKIGSLCDSSDSHSLLSTRPPLEYESSTNNLSSLKSEDKNSTMKKFDNFSNLGEKLKQSDVNLRETTVVKKEEIMEACSDVAESSENETDSSEMKVEIPCDSNMSSLDNLSSDLANVDLFADKIFSDDSRSSIHSLRHRAKSSDMKDERSRSDKKTSSCKSKEIKTEKNEIDKRDESSEKTRDTEKKDRSKNSSLFKYGEIKTKYKDESKDKSKSVYDKDRQNDKHKSSKEKSSHGSEKHKQHDSEKDKKDRPDNDEESKMEDKKFDDSKDTVSNKHPDKKRHDEKSKHHSKERDSKSHRKTGNHSKSDDKDNDKSMDKDKKSEHRSRHDINDKYKRDSSSKSSRSRTDDKKNKENRKKDVEKPDEDDAKKKSPKKRKSGRCEEDEIKSKNSRRSSDRDSNGNAGGGGSSKSKSSSSSHNGRGNSKSEKGRTSSKNNKESTNNEEVDNANDCIEIDKNDEIDMMLMAINNSIEDVSQRVNVSEFLSEPNVKKPKIAKNFHEIRKIMQARQSIHQIKPNEMTSSPVPKTPDDLKDEGVDKDKSSPEEIDVTENVCNDHHDREILGNITDEESGEVSVNSSPRSASQSPIILKDCCIVVTDILKGSLKNSFLLKDRGTGDLSFRNTAFFTAANSTNDGNKVEKLQNESADDEYTTSNLQPVSQASSIDEDIGKREDSVGQKVKIVMDASCAESSEFKTGVDTIPITSVVHLQSTAVNIKEDFTITAHSPQTCINDSLVKDVNVAPNPDSIDITNTNSLSEESNLQDLKTIDCMNGEISESEENSELTEPNSLAKEVPGGIPKKPKKIDCNKKRLSCQDQSLIRNSPLPSRSSRRSNAGNRMYAILEGFSEKASNKQGDSSVSHSNRRKACNVEPAQEFEKGLNVGICSSLDNNISGAEDKSLLPEVSSKSCTADDGSDVSNKENDGANSTGNVKSQKGDVVSNDTRNDIRSSKRRKSVSIKPEDPKKLIEDLNESDVLSKGCSIMLTASVEESANKNENSTKMGEANQDDKKLDVSTPNRHNTGKGLKTPLILRNRDIDLRVVKTGNNNSDVLGSTDDNVDGPKMSDVNQKSLESLKMDKENITTHLEPENPVSDSDKGSIAVSHRRKSCPDIFQAREVSTLNEKKLFEELTSDNSDMGELTVVTKDVSSDSNPNEREGIDKTENAIVESTRRSMRRSTTARNNVKMHLKDDNGRRSRRTISKTNSNRLRKSESHPIQIDDGKTSLSGTYNASENNATLDDLSSSILPNKTGVDEIGVDGSAPSSNDNSQVGRCNNLSSIGEVATQSNSSLMDAREVNEDASTIQNSVTKVTKKMSRKRGRGAISTSKEKYVDDTESNHNITDQMVGNSSQTSVTPLPDKKSCTAGPEKSKIDHTNNSCVEHTGISDPNEDRVSPIVNVMVPVTAQGGKCENADEPTFEQNNSDSPESVEEIQVDNPTCSQSRNTIGTTNNTLVRKGKRSLKARAPDVDSLTNDSNILDFKGISGDDRSQNSEDGYKGFSAEDIHEATVKLNLLRCFISKLLNPAPPAKVVSGQPRAKKIRVASDCMTRSRGSQESDYVAPSQKKPRKRNFSLNSSPEKDKKEVLGAQCKAESKDSGLCVSPEQPSFLTEVSQKKAVPEPTNPGADGLRTRKSKGAYQKKSSQDDCRLSSEDNNSDPPSKKKMLTARNSQRYSANDLYKPRPVVGREIRLNTSTNPKLSANVRPKRSR